MMMKTMKLMMATALATTTLLGTFIESAEAVSRGKGNEPSGSRKDPIEVEYNFKLYEITPTGVPRKDEDKNNDPNIGIFTGAIEEFQGRINKVGNERPFQFDLVNITGLFAEPGEDIDIPNPLTLDLTAKFILAKNPISLPDGTPVFDLSGKNFFEATQDRIEYTLTSSALEDRGISELTLIITDLDSFDDINGRIQAVNSLTYIIENQLLEKVNYIRVSGKVLNSSKISASESFTDPGSIASRRIEDRVVEVPESTPTNSLLALGALGAGLLLKRKMK
jgi:hypothetical protein